LRFIRRFDKINLYYFTKGHLVNKKQSQSGSIHLIITIVLAVALIGALGFVFYQNYMQPKASDNNAVVSNETDDTATTVTDTVDDATTADVATVMNDDGYLVFNDWNVKFKLPADLGDDEIVYEKAGDTSGSNEMYYVSTKHLSALGSECAKAYRLIRSAEAPTGSVGSPKSIGEIGNYYYSYYTPQVSCADNKENGTDVENKVFNMFGLMFESIEKK